MTSFFASTAKNKEAPPPLLEIRAAAAAAWPGLTIDVHALINEARVPLDEFQTDGGTFRHGHSNFSPDALDALILRTIRQLPQNADGQHVAGPREFARVLALLRQASSRCKLIEEPRMKAVHVLSEPPNCVLHIAPTPGSSRSVDAALRITACATFRCADSGRVLGWPLARELSYWTFEHAVTPPAHLPDDALLRKLFDGTSPHRGEFTDASALELLSHARANTGRINLHIDPKINTQGIRLEPLREKITVRCADAGNIEVMRELFTPRGDPAPYPVERISNPPGCPSNDGGLQIRPPSHWLDVNGVRYPLPADFSGSWLSDSLPRETSRDNPHRARHCIEGDAIPLFVLDVLPKLKQLGAIITPEVEKIAVCSTLKPALQIVTDEGSNAFERVRARFYFEPAAAFRAPAAGRVAIAPVEILAAAAQGKKYIRQGDAFFRVDRELVAGCRKRLQASCGDSNSEFEAQRE